MAPLLILMSVTAAAASAVGLASFLILDRLGYFTPKHGEPYNVVPEGCEAPIERRRFYMVWALRRSIQPPVRERGRHFPLVPRSPLYELPPGENQSNRVAVAVRAFVLSGTTMKALAANDARLQRGSGRSMPRNWPRSALAGIG